MAGGESSQRDVFLHDRNERRARREETDLVEIIFADDRWCSACSTTTIRFVLDAEREVDLAVFDVSGRRVATLVSGLLPAGEHEYRWGDSKSLDRISSGIYFCRLEADGKVLSRKMMFVR